MTHAVRSKEAGIPKLAVPPSASATTGFAVRARKTIAASPSSTFAAWTDSRRRAGWLVGVKLTIRTRTAPRFVRLTCSDDGTDIAVTILARGRAKSAVVVDHTRLASAQIVAERRHCWKEMLRNLKRYLEKQG